ncbi:allophanate hydrolase [Xanthobacter variabilis]|uniref:allophanate hydrolase n=1 Tax=Xanthobacter variabilis TaxID=3119932 RepID=UPI00374E62B2
MLPDMLDISTLKAGYGAGTFTPLDVIEEVIRRLHQATDPAIWISRFSDDELRAAARALMAEGGREARPLWGMPFAVKDNIDVKGLATTAACPAFAYEPARDAVVVERLKAAGALVIGKTNLDQFATGLNGTRSPYGAPRSVFNADYISGGSSSGSAVAVASGLVAFSLGTDTAGSGRVPAAFNNLVGVKPTKGLVPNTGLVPACRSLDCISVFGVTTGDATLVRQVMEGVDEGDAYSRAAAARPLPLTGFRFGVLAGKERFFDGDKEAEALYDTSIARLTALGGTAVPINYAPFRDCANLLYGGPWVAERLAAIENFFDGHAQEMDPTVRTIVGGGRKFSAVDAFCGAYALEAYRKATDGEWAKMDVLLLPTAPRITTVADMQAEPIARNSMLGRYTNFVNLLDCCGVAVPAGFRADGLPVGVTLIAPAFCDDALAVLADRLHRAAAKDTPCGLGRDRGAALPEAARLAPSTDGLVPLVVVGAHLSGMPLNPELTRAGGVLLRACRTTPDYRLHELPGTVPPKPGLVREPGFAGPGIEVEVWGLPAAAFGAFVAAIPAPLGIGKISLDDGSAASGFLCEAHAIAQARDITSFGGWRAWRAQGSAA